jgi:putative DNA primase/helicase
VNGTAFDRPNLVRIAELAKLDPISYEQIRVLEAEVMGVRVGALDEEVRRIRAKNTEGSPVESLEPWPESVSGSDLITQLATIYSRHLVLPPHAETAAALWIVHTYAIDAAVCSPLLTWQSPTYRCGKTTAETITCALASRAVMASNISPAAVYRFVDQHAPTLVLDEADTFAKDNEGLRGILNSGHTRAGAYVIRCGGEDFQPQRFSTWCAKSIALIGKLPATLQDRSIVISMRRKLPTARVESLPDEPIKVFHRLRRECRRWVDDHMYALRSAKVRIVPLLNDRATDNWLPLLKVAEMAGGEWPEKARAAALALGGDSNELVGVGQQLLADIQKWFAGCGSRAVRSRDLANHLAGLEGRPWAHWKRGQAISPNQIAQLLSDFEIEPGTVRFTAEKNGTDKGYERTQFEEAFARYLPAETVTSSQL